MTRSTVTRRDILKGALGAVAALPLSTSFTRSARAQQGEPRYLFVVCASGGADIRDSFLPLAASVASSGVRSRPDADLRTVGALRCVERVQPDRFYVGAGTVTGQNGPVQRTFLERHGQDVAVLTTTGTSVNHITAAKRWLNGAGLVGHGRTILEAHAMAHATQDMPLPVVNMSNGGYVSDGDDPTVPGFARGETVANALLFGVATHPSRGMRPLARGDRQEALLARARAVREQLDDGSAFVGRHASSRLLQDYRRNRRSTVPLMDELDLITQLSMVADSSGVPLAQYGLAAPQAQVDLLASVGFQGLITDPFMAQAALAFLLVKSGASCAVAIGAPPAPMPGPGYGSQPFTLRHTPIAFDFCHTDHEPTQLAMWDRTLLMTDGLIRLLKATPAGTGTLWDRSLVYIATEFGRTTTRPAGTGAFGTGHELNNGAVIISPLVKGNRVFGGLDPTTGRTTGWDESGAASADPDHVRGEAHVIATLGATLGHSLTAADERYALRVVPRAG